MVQSLIVYAIVAAAAAWTAWRFVLRGWFRRRGAAKDCGPDCGCGD